MESQEMRWLLEDKYGGEKSDAFFADCKRLALGEPLAYLIGWVSFLNCKIWLDSKPLIPRPETEFWTMEAIQTIRGGKTASLGLEDNSPKILDLCSGSGCIGIAIAKAIPETRVDFGEIDSRLIPTIKKNIYENLSDIDKYSVIHTNLFENLTGKYNFILTNPPYINESLNRHEKSVKDHEPYLALFGGEKGMEIINKIIIDAPNYLATNGQLWIEHEPEQSTMIKELASDYTVTHCKDQYGVERYSILVLK